jgi:hypothetical protein
MVTAMTIMVASAISLWMVNITTAIGLLESLIPTPEMSVKRSSGVALWMAHMASFVGWTTLNRAPETNRERNSKPAVMMALNLIVLVPAPFRRW